jgi:hypothetical protein
MRKRSKPKLHEVKGGTKTKIYCNAMDNKLPMTKVGNLAKPLKYTKLQQMFRCMTTNLETQPTTMQQRLTCALENAGLLPDVCCCLNNMGNKILFRINWRCVTSMWPHGKKSIGVRSGDLAGQAIGPPHPIQRLL